LEPVKFAQKQALVIILNDNKTRTTGIENVLFTEKDRNKPQENKAGLIFFLELKRLCEISV